MNCEKDSTYRDHNKTATKRCSNCWYIWYKASCVQCGSHCIFSLPYFKACQDNKSLRERLKEKYYKKDFDSLRTFLFKEGEEVESLNEYDLLEMYLNKYVKAYPYPHIIVNEWALNKPYTKAKMKGRCYHHRTIGINNNVIDQNRTCAGGNAYSLERAPSRYNKKKTLMRENEDFTMI